jgi:photosynthetic reaction center cytochrome c subunit
MSSDSYPEGSIAKYDARQREILRGELVGLIGVVFLALAGVIGLGMSLSESRAKPQGWRGEPTYNYAGVQQVGYNDYLVGKGQEPAKISAEALAAYTKWQQANPNTVNVQVLTKYLGDKYNSTANVFGYMSAYFVPGVGQSCEYCHNLENFSDYSKPTKTTAKAMLTMQFELQNKWITTIPRPEGQPLYQLKCASCHYGQAKFWNNDLKATNPAAFGIAGGGNPTDFDLRQLGLKGADTSVGYTFADTRFLQTRADGNGNTNWFKVTADDKTPPGLVDTYRNQNAMYHMNASLGVGCDFCHYAGYFSSYVTEENVFKWPKAQARHMMGMVQDISLNWFPQMPNVQNSAQPNCYMCHRNYVVPPGDYLDPELPKQVSNPDIVPIVNLPAQKSILPK